MCPLSLSPNRSIQRKWLPHWRARSTGRTRPTSMGPRRNTTSVWPRWVSRFWMLFVLKYHVYTPHLITNHKHNTDELKTCPGRSMRDCHRKSSPFVIVNGFTKLPWNLLSRKMSLAFLRRPEKFTLFFVLILQKKVTCLIQMVGVFLTLIKFCFCKLKWSDTQKFSKFNLICPYLLIGSPDLRSLELIRKIIRLHIQRLVALQIRTPLNHEKVWNTT